MTTLDEIYESLPKMECRGFCSDSCFSVGLTSLEAGRIDVRHGRVIVTGFHEDGCPALSPFRRCEVYVDRPLICRLWGMVPSMACPYGCEPEGGMMSEVAGQELMDRLLRLPAM